jgi:hypothetical protein
VVPYLGDNSPAVSSRYHLLLGAHHLPLQVLRAVGVLQLAFICAIPVQGVCVLQSSEVNTVPVDKHDILAAQAPNDGTIQAVNCLDAH